MGILIFDRFWLFLGLGRNNVGWDPQIILKQAEVFFLYLEAKIAALVGAGRANEKALHLAEW